MKKIFVWAVLVESNNESHSIGGWGDFFDVFDTDIVLFDSKEKAVEYKNNKLKEALQTCLDYNIINSKIKRALKKHLDITVDYSCDDWDNNVSFSSGKDFFEIQGSDEDNEEYLAISVKIIKKEVM